MVQGVLLAAYAASGMAGLIYEVSWTRLLTLHLGRGLAASSTVLAAYMGGLALGAAIAGRIAARWSPQPALRTYAALEILVAVLALAIPFELQWLTPVFAGAYGEGPGLAFGVVRFGTALLLLLLPALALGATFPLAVRGTAGLPGSAAAYPGRLYAMNTVGAALGAALSGFVLLPAFGVLGTLAIGVVASGAAAAAAFALAARPSVGGAVSGTDPGVAGAGAPRGTSVPRAVGSGVTLACLLLGVTGAATFIAEVGWTRVFAMLVGPSTYAFAATVSVFITGLAIGAGLGAFIGARVRPAMAAAWMLGLGAWAAAWTGAAAGGLLPHAVAADFAGAASVSIVARAIPVVSTVLPLAVAIGAVFPLALLLAGGSSADPRTIGIVYAVNTVAAVLASLAAGFVLVPRLGLEHTLAIVPVLLAVGAVIAALSSGTPIWQRGAALVPAVAALAYVSTAPPWDRGLLASGAYKYASAIAPGLDLETALTAGSLLYYRDGATATVSVKRVTGSLALAIDGKVDASTAGDMLTQKLLAQLPLLLHGAARDVGIIGLGSGITAASALTHDIERLDVIEIAPEVVEASRLFAAPGAGPLDDPRTRMLVTDARTHMALSSRRYDVIVSEPSNPWLAGVAALFTREFFTAALAHLNPHGVICQWVNTYDISTTDLQSVVATFSAVFPHTTLWLVGDGDLMLIGSADPLEPRLAQLGEGLTDARVRADLSTLGVRSPFGLLSMFAGGDAAAARFGAGAPLQTDSRMALEFSAPMALHTSERRQNVVRLRALAGEVARPAAVESAWQAATGADLAERAVILRRAGAFEPAYEAATAALANAPDQADALDVLAAASAALGRQADAIALLARVVADHADLAAPRVALSRLQASTGHFEPAIGVLTEYLERHPADGAALEQLASIFADVGDGPRLAPVVSALRAMPDRAGAHYYAAALQFMQGQMYGALDAARQALAIDPRHARAQNLVGAIKATRGDVAGARQAFDAALALDAQDPTTYQNLAQLEAGQGNSEVARRLYAEALAIDPASTVAREGLATLKPAGR
ncbi:MAG: hypothetical protein U0Q55_13040 [Vicinamibacterales bacterium]